MPYATFSPQEIASITAFRASSMEMVLWHQSRAEGFGRKAANLLGLGGLAMALVPFAVKDLGQLHTWAKVGVRLSLVAAALALAIAVINCIRVLHPQKEAVLAPDTTQLEEEWKRFRDDRVQHAAEVEAMFVDSLLRGRSGEGVLTSMKKYANRKACGVRLAVYATVAGVSLLSSAVMFAVFGTRS